MSSDLIRDDSIEKNAQILIDEISNPGQEVNPKEVNPKDQDYGHSNNTSIIHANVDDYLKLFNVEKNSDNENVVSKCNPVDSD